MKYARAAMLLAMAVLAALGSAMPAPAYAQDAKFDAARDAVRDVARAVAEAGRAGKNVLVDVGGEWCVWCHRLDGFFATHADARELRERNYVTVKVNWSPQNHNDALLSRWPRIDGYPHLFVLDGDGKLLRSQSTGELERGRGYDRDKMLAFLRRYAPRGAPDRVAPRADPAGAGAQRTSARSPTRSRSSVRA